VSIIARATAIFFGLCAATFLPAFVVDSMFSALPLSALVAALVSLVSQPPGDAHLAPCFSSPWNGAKP